MTRKQGYTSDALCLLKQVCCKILAKAPVAFLMMLFLIITLLIVAFTVCICLIIYAFQNLHASVVKWFIASMAVMAYWDFNSILTIISKDFDTQITLSYARFLFAPFNIAFAFVLITKIFSFPAFTQKPKFRLVFFIIPVLTSLSVLFSNTREFLFYNFKQFSAYGITVVEYKDGILMRFFLFYADIVFLIIILRLLWAILKDTQKQRNLAIIILLGCFFTTFVDFYCRLNSLPSRWLQIPPALFLITASTFGIAIFKYSLFDLTSLAKDRIFKNLPDALWVFDAQENLVLCNDSASIYTNNFLTSKGQSAQQCFTNYPMLLNLFKNKTDCAEIVIEGNNKNPDNFVFRFLPLGKNFTNNVCVGNICILQNISSYKYLEAQLSNKNNELTNINRLLSKQNSERNKMLALISHDVMGNFHAVTRNMRLIIEAPEYGRADLTEAYETQLLTLELLNSLVCWARSQKEDFNIEAKPFEINTLVFENVQYLEYFASIKKVTLNIEKCDSKCVVIADSMVVSTILRNLISNAIKAAPINSECFISVTIKNTSFLHIKISDKKALKTSEQSAYNKAQYTSPSFGIGLSIIRDLIKHHNGEFWIENEGINTTIANVIIPITMINPSY